jgi:hypothetical protein
MPVSGDHKVNDKNSLLGEMISIIKIIKQIACQRPKENQKFGFIL